MLQAGDLSGESGLRDAYSAHAGELYRFALRGLGDPGLAQDAVQETFLRAWQSAGRYDPTLASLRVWLFAIARNVLVDLHRRRTKASFAAVTGDEGGVADSLPPVADGTDAVVDRAVVLAALDRLSVEQRQVIVETYLRGRSYDDLAAECGVPAGTLRSRSYYALRALRVTMDDMGVSL